jgi:hypothetical protein
MENCSALKRSEIAKKPRNHKTSSQELNQEWRGSLGHLFARLRLFRNRG